MVATRAQARSRPGGPAQASASNGPQKVAAQGQARSKALPKNSPKSKTPAKSQSKHEAEQKTLPKREAPRETRPKTKASGNGRSKGKQTSKAKGCDKENSAPPSEAEDAQRSAVDPSVGASPTTSDGPEFHPPLRAPREAIVAARSIIRSDVGNGFKNPGHLCYRNATIVMLLHSNRFMSWIENRHIPNLTGAGLRVKTYSKPHIDALIGLKSRDDQIDDDTETLFLTNYTDVWCELFELSRVYWDESHNTRKTLNAAMEIFWNYVTDPQRDQERIALAGDMFRTKMKEAGEDQCASEFLGWLITLSVDQLRYFIQEWVGRHAHRMEETTLIRVANLHDLNIYELLRVTQTQRVRCMQCGSRRNVKTRFSSPIIDNILSLPLAATPNSDVPVRLEDCLAKNSKNDIEWLCSDCGRQGVGLDSENQDGAKRNHWKKIYSTPEVLFVQLARFKLMKDRRGNVMYGKDATQVDIPEELDLTPFLERRGEPAKMSANYQLKAIVNHQGDKDRGHYVCYVRRGEIWHVFNDALRVKKISFKDILNHKGGYTPYMLLYERIVQNEEDSVDGDQVDAPSGGNTVGDAGGDSDARNTEDKRDRSNEDGRGGGNQRRDCQSPVNGGAQDGPQSSSAQLKVATEKDPRPGQLFIDIKAGVGRYEFKFPTLVLENYARSTNDNHAFVEMWVRDSEGQTWEIEGSAAFSTRQVREGADCTSIKLKPTLGPGLTLSSTPSIWVAWDDRPHFNRAPSADTELDPELLPDLPKHSPNHCLPQTYFLKSDPGTPFASQRSRSDDGPPFFYQTPSVQAKLREIFNDMELFYQEKTKQDLHSTIVSPYQQEIATMRDLLAWYQELLLQADDPDGIRDYWQRREAELLDEHQKMRQQIAELQEQIRLLQGWKVVQYHNLEGEVTNPGVKHLNIKGRAGIGKVGAGQKRTLDHVDEDVQEVCNEVWTRASTFKRARTTSGIKAETGANEQLPDNTGYDSRHETELHYDSSGQRLYSSTPEDEREDWYGFGEEDGDDDGPDNVEDFVQKQHEEEESPLPDYEDMVHPDDDEGYDGLNETSPRQTASWWYTNYAARLAAGNLPSTPKCAMQQTRLPRATSKPTPLQIKHSPGQGWAGGRLRSSPQYYQTSPAGNNDDDDDDDNNHNNVEPCWHVRFDEDGQPHYFFL
ncbi:uncharacterized protein Z519_05032 [Cladophialophora bantiana CBS 173.52]|uniref:USP domain-containing protein n=1 Tax=Cladophialophora bantiana (strain ATCC 10958 / CBS 173.52 / CDC B-1940 / NIH 8579) TaxID=1442370 RepID=A0A0D2HKB1_CLAB1|nr:uncharacterized protein Z519_05032 [Cladophialophora bantiana CBS 173.52]KIW93718.1 hypothetical protein Z519_05032 [Cladophialophora bantiana CBS 173.52]